MDSRLCRVCSQPVPSLETVAEELADAIGKAEDPGPGRHAYALGCLQAHADFAVAGLLGCCFGCYRRLQAAVVAYRVGQQLSNSGRAA